jgi:uncharacterized protein (DUF924 family)
MIQPAEILGFWFNKLPDESGSSPKRQVWFRKEPGFDRQIAAQFQAVYEQAATGELNHWQTTPTAALALVLVLDQFPRHLFRGQPRAFATDAQALAVAQRAIAHGYDQQVSPIQRVFFYLPLEHSENLHHQQQCVALFEPLRQDPDLGDYYIYAEKHRDVIQRFGRFPHRNAILDRPSTEAELAFLQQPGSSF